MDREREREEERERKRDEKIERDWFEKCHDSSRRNRSWLPPINFCLFLCEFLIFFVKFVTLPCGAQFKVFHRLAWLPHEHWKLWLTCYLRHSRGVIDSCLSHCYLGESELSRLGWNLNPIHRLQRYSDTHPRQIN